MLLILSNAKLRIRGKLNRHAGEKVQEGPTEEGSRSGGLEDSSSIYDLLSPTVATHCHMDILSLPVFECSCCALTDMAVSMRQ